MVKEIFSAIGKKCTKSTSAAAKTSAKKRVKFEVAAGVGKTVSIAGSFNEWDPTVKYLQDKDGNGIYVGYLMLAPGIYEYKFIIDGEWRLDDKNANFAPNDFGTLNSVLVVK
ncbi:MAG: glycogen-binding domain-containing protein [Lentisphaeria bacterium]|nr:glycogen-binding domain-containing protein [Lentisphaeria bacterium]